MQYPVEGMNEQVLIRLILSEMYPIRTKCGKWLYFFNEATGEYVGTHKDNDFLAHWGKQLFYLGEGQLSIEEIAQVRKLDYLLTDEYKARFERWKFKTIKPAPPTGA